VTQVGLETISPEPRKPATRALSGSCRHARTEAGRVRLKAAAGFHAECRGRWHTKPGEAATVCGCPCHRKREIDLAAVLAEARKARHEASGIDLNAKPPRSMRSHCRHGHELTPENTGPKGDCRLCKRASSARAKAKRRARG
jgi:hypothetical protein